MNSGWIGIMSQLTWYLHIVGADQNEEGQYLIFPKGSVATFMGLDGPDAEILVGQEAQYFIDGQSAGLAAGLRSTSYGTKVKVIM